MARQNLGRVAMVFKGEYASFATYNKLDVVTYNGSSYVCNVDSTSGVVPTNTDNWGLLAEKGYTPQKGTDYWTNQDKSEVVSSAITQVETDIQPTLNNIQTTANTANTTANTAKSIAEGANQALSFNNYQTMITRFNALDDDTYNVGQNMYILTLEVPDLWISSVESTSVPYTYTTDEAIIAALETNGYIQVGYYRLSALETQKVDLTNYVENTDYATSSTGGVVKTGNGFNVSNGVAEGVTRTSAQFGTDANNYIMSKGTFNNVWSDRTQIISESDYENLSTKDNNVLYLIPEEE